MQLPEVRSWPELTLSVTFHVALLTKMQHTHANAVCFHE